LLPDQSPGAACSCCAHRRRDRNETNSGHS
jgi:hypothetical protein